jgi:hypothetical protein
MCRVKGVNVWLKERGRQRRRRGTGNLIKVMITLLEAVKKQSPIPEDIALPPGDLSN